MTRSRSEELDGLISVGHKISVGHDGFVRIVDYMGNDAAIVQAARVSYGEGTKRVREDRGLIRYLMRHKHTSPFEMCEIKFHLRVPMDIWRQFVRHRTASINEYSTRYSVAIDSAARVSDWRKQATNNKQGSSDEVFTGEEAEYLTSRESELLEFARTVYEERIDRGVAREQARKDLPLSTYTEAYWKMDLRNLLHFLSLRLESHAQQEIREFARALRFYVRAWVPLAFEAFEDYQLNSISLSAQEHELLKQLLAENISTALHQSSHTLSGRELREFTEKLGITNE